MKEQSGARRRSNKNPTTEKTTGGISDNNNARQQVSILYKIAQRRTSPCLSKPPGARRRLTMATMGDEWSYSVRGEDDELEVSLKLFTASHDANTNAAFPTVTARPLVRSRPEDDVEDHSRYEKASRAVVPPEPTIPKEVEKPKSSPVKVSQAQENDVIFTSTAMGIGLKRGEDGFVRVVSVTEATIGSSIVRDGIIEPEDRILEAAGIDLRSSITNSQWGDTVAKIRSAPRPMKFVVACGPRRQNPVIPSRSAGVQQNRPVGQSKASKLYGSALRPISSHQAGSDGSYRESDAVKSVASSTVDDESTHTSEQPKDSFFRRIACPSPVTACAVPKQSQHTDTGEGSQVPMAHLQFLRTNPTIKRVTNAASRRYPALCGTPATIFEEPEDDESKVTMDHYVMDRTRSAASSTNDGSRTMSTLDQGSTQMSQREDITNEEEDDQCEI